MEEYTDSYRLYPLWAMLLLTIPVGLGAWGVSAARYSDTLAGTPLFVLFAYGLAVGYMNRAWVRVTAEGVETGFGPLPCGVQPAWVPRQEVAEVYVRFVSVSARSGQSPYWAAGVQRTDGQFVDLTDQWAPLEEIQQSAQEIAATLQWTAPIQLLRGSPPYGDPRRTAPLLLWSGLVAAAIVWAALKRI